MLISIECANCFEGHVASVVTRQLRLCNHLQKTTKQPLSIHQKADAMRHNMLRSRVDGESSPHAAGNAKLHLDTLPVVYP